MISQAVNLPRGPAQPAALTHERRRRVRHRVHTPAYTSLKKNSARMLPDLHEIMDISEEGLCFRNSTQLRAGESLALNLDFSETRAVIDLAAKVVWSDPSGRTGVEFHKVPAESLAKLKEWLFVNTLIACSNLKETHESAEDMLGEESSAEFVEVRATPDYTSVLAAVAAVGEEVEALGNDVDKALDLVAERAQTLTRATGAAIALTTGELTICRATSGSDAPGVGVSLDTTSGFSAECLRTGHLMHCDDSETDVYVDRDACRTLGIRSIMAAPVWRREVPSGLLEIFSPYPGAFGEGDKIVVQRLAEMAGAAVNRAIHSLATSADAEASTAEVSSVGQVASKETPSWRRILLSVVVIAVLLLLGLFLVPRVRENVNDPTPASPSAEAGTVPAASYAENLRKLADMGDSAAQFSIGARYAAGEEVKQDYTEAARWFSLSAERGNVVAQSTLAAYYWAGTGVAKDLRKAYFWALLAQAGGDEASRLRVSVLASLLKRSEIVAEQQRADNWLKQHGLGSTPEDTR